MVINDVIPGDLVYSKLHQGWCLVLSVNVERIRWDDNKPIVRIKVLQTAVKKEFHISLQSAVELTTLKNYAFYRDGEKLL